MFNSNKLFASSILDVEDMQIACVRFVKTITADPFSEDGGEVCMSVLEICDMQTPGEFIRLFVSDDFRDGHLVKISRQDVERWGELLPDFPEWEIYSIENHQNSEKLFLTSPEKIWFNRSASGRIPKTIRRLKYILFNYRILPGRLPSFDAAQYFGVTNLPKGGGDVVNFVKMTPVDSDDTAFCSVIYESHAESIFRKNLIAHFRCQILDMGISLLRKLPDSDESTKPTAGFLYENMIYRAVFGMPWYDAIVKKFNREFRNFGMPAFSGGMFVDPDELWYPANWMSEDELECMTRIVGFLESFLEMERSFLNLSARYRVDVHVDLNHNDGDDTLFLLFSNLVRKYCFHIGLSNLADFTQEMYRRDINCDPESRTNQRLHQLFNTITE